jgi:prophage tail gpP-like protein
MPRAVLQIGSALYEGWTRISVARALDRVSGRFDLTLTERWPGQRTMRPVRPGQACTVALDGHTVITGYVDEVSVDYDATAHTVSVQGRDKTGDLADCSAPASQFTGRTLAQVARELCAPYGVQVRDLAQAGAPFRTFKGGEGDSVLEVLEAAARVRAVLLTSDGAGNLVLTRSAGASRGGALTLGGNVVKCSARFSERDRHHLYTVKGQAAGDDDWSGEAAAHPCATARDQGVTRHRPKTIIAEESIDQAAATARAAWERDVRYGRSRTVTYTVQGWTHPGGLWEPGALARVEDAFLGYDGAELLVCSATWLLDDEGCRTELDLCPPEAFALVELPEPGEEEGW